MKLFDIYGTLGIDTSQFEADIKAAQDEAQQLENVLNDVDSTDLDISKQRRKFVQSMKQMVDSAEDLDRELAKVENSVDDVDVSKIASETSVASEMAKGAFDGLADAGKDLLETAVEEMVKFVETTLAYVATTETEVGKTLEQSNTEWDWTQKVVMQRFGRVLVPLTVTLREIAAELAKVTDTDKLRVAMDELEKLRKEKLIAVKETLTDIVGLFDKIQLDSDNMPALNDMIEGLRSQADYWQEYSAHIAYLQTMGYDPRLISQLADGSIESLQQMRALAMATETEVAEINRAYDDVISARDTTAEGIADAQMLVDETAVGIVESMKRMLEVDTGPLANAGYGTVMAIADGMEYASPYLRRVCQDILGMGEKLNSFGLIVDESFVPTDAITKRLDETAAGVDASMGKMLEVDTGAFEDTGYTVVEAIGKGMESAVPYLESVCQGILGIGAQLSGFGANVGGSLIPNDWLTRKLGGEFNAKGLNYVPYNDYVSRLHVGEAVLTRQQADQWRAGQGNGFDMGAFAEMLTANLSNSVAGLRVQMDGRTVGQLVSGTVSREIAKQSRRRLTSV